MASEIKLYNQDCMIALKEMKDKEFDLAIVDPPYGISISQDLAIRGQTCSNNGYRAWEYKEWDAPPPAIIF